MSHEMDDPMALAGGAALAVAAPHPRPLSLKRGQEAARELMERRYAS